MTQRVPNKADIGLRDLLIALADLPWQTEAHKKAIFNALGFAWQDSKPETLDASSPRQIFDRNRYQQRQSIKPMSQTPPGFSPPPTPPLPVELPERILNSQLEALEAIAEKAPGWLDQDNLFLADPEPQVKAARTNLFPDLTHRGILSVALRVQKRGKDVDMPRLIKHVIQGQIPKIVPTRTEVTLERGCQLLLDYSDSMVPFWEDLTALAVQVQNVLGKERVKIYEFDQNPTAGQCWDNPIIAQPWHADDTRPILVASDLGINGGRVRWPIGADWRKFIAICYQKQIPLIVLIPWCTDYWPEIHSSHPILVHWNPHTTATLIKKRVGAGHLISV
jgi:hypothetical protein